MENGTAGPNSQILITCKTFESQLKREQASPEQHKPSVFEGPVLTSGKGPEKPTSWSLPRKTIQNLAGAYSVDHSNAWAERGRSDDEAHFPLSLGQGLVWAAGSPCGPKLHQEKQATQNMFRDRNASLEGDLQPWRSETLSL